MKKDIFIYIAIVIIILLFGISFGVMMYNNGKSKPDEQLANSDVNYTLSDVKKEFLKTKYSKENKCSVDINSKSIVIKCKKETSEFKINNDFLEVSTNSNGLELVKNVVNVVEHLLGSDKDYLDVMDTFFTGKIFLNNIFMNKSNDSYSFGISLSNIIDYYVVNDVYEGQDYIDVEKRDYEINFSDYVVSDIDFASDSEAKLYVITGTIYNENKKYDKKIKVTYYDKSGNVLDSNFVYMNDFDKTNTFLRFSIVSEFSDSKDIEKVSKYMLNIE